MENDLSGTGGTAADRPSVSEARAALEAMDADASQLAGRLVTPWWYHLILAAMVTAIIGAQALPGVSSMTTIVLILIWVPFLMKAYTDRYHVSMTRPTGPRSKRMLLLILAVLAVLMASVVLMKLGGLLSWWVLVPAAAGFVATVVLGRRYDAVLREEIAAQGGRG